MKQSVPKILLSGPPGCGKTTIIKRVVSGLRIPAKGFFTEEVRGKDGQRIGFDVVVIDGRRGPLARVDYKGHRVGRYGVCLDFLETVALPDLSEPVDALIVVDEIGKMECFSSAFQGVVISILSGGSPVIGTLALGGSAFIREVRSKKDVEIIGVTQGNRERLVKELVKRLEV
jgi:nucleoside-triphosphatase